MLKPKQPQLGVCCSLTKSAVAFTLAGCTSVPFALGDKDAETRLKAFPVLPGKTSLFVCREDTGYAASSLTTEVLVSGSSIGSVKPGTFVHGVLAPGRHTIEMRNDGPHRGTAIQIDAKASELAFLWIGVTGRGFGQYTIDFFQTDEQARACVAKAAYAAKVR